MKGDERMRSKKSDDWPLEKAFSEFSEDFAAGVEAGFLRGKRAMARRRRMRRMAAVAAACLALAVIGVWGALRSIGPAQDRVASQGGTKVSATPLAGFGTPTQTPGMLRYTLTPEPSLTPEPPLTPEPTNTPLPAEEVVELAYYYTPGGRYYHALSDCMGMLEATTGSVKEVMALGKERCPECQPGQPDGLRQFVQATGRTLEEMYPGYAYYYFRKNGYGDGGAWIMSDGFTEIEAVRVKTADFVDNTSSGMVLTVQPESGIMRHPDAPDVNLAAFLADAPEPFPNLIEIVATHGPIEYVQFAFDGNEVMRAVRVRYENGEATLMLDVSTDEWKDASSREIDDLTGDKVWANRQGYYYHNEEHCSGMQAAELMGLTEAVAVGKRPCPVCVGSEEGGVSTLFDMAGK